MTKVTVDDALRGKLHNLTQPLELCDESGRVVAQMYPVDDLRQYDLWQPDVAAEELHRQERTNQRWYTTSEVLQRLEES